MARKHYKLTDETFQVLSKHEAAIAREMECDPSYVYKIKNGDEPDRFPPFRELFRAAANAGAPANIWLNDLTAIYIKSRMTTASAVEISLELAEKISADAASAGEILNSLADGKIDKAECHRILAALEKVEQSNQKIKQIVLRRLGELSESKQ